MHQVDMLELARRIGLPGPDLLLRDYGRRAFTLLERELGAVAGGDCLVLDFSQVTVMDTSFADEAILPLAVGLAEGRYGDRFLVLLRPSPATVDNLEGTIARRRAKVAIAIDAGDRVVLVGHLEANLVEVWQMLSPGDELTARELADQLGLEINTASTRLRKLFDARLLARREKIGPEGRQHVYRLPCGTAAARVDGPD